MKKVIISVIFALFMVNTTQASVLDIVGLAAAQIGIDAAGSNKNSASSYEASKRREKLAHFFGMETDTDKAIKLERKRKAAKKAAILKEVNSIDLSKDGNLTNISQTVGAYIARKKDNNNDK